MAAELQRRILLTDSDLLLDDVESLRLSEEVEAPLRLREAIRALQIRLGRRNPPLPPPTLAAAHDLVFAVQQRIMAANPKNPRPARHANRASGQPVITIVREDRKWKVLSLPPPSSGDEWLWLELVEATVERAWDRWCYAQHQATRAARLHLKPLLALAIARAAWENYWLLLQDAERIRARLAAERPSAPRL
ncbi:MAG TPA: hypothetical protein VJS19_00180 [Candidatus Dormibacteraeota bacterium]|nr:hypothetical protein [Candidatus Dormibacteraeota bacterium]